MSPSTSVCGGPRKRGKTLVRAYGGGGGGGGGEGDMAVVVMVAVI